MSKTVPFQTIQFSKSTQFNCQNYSLALFNPYIGPLSGATTQGLSGPGSDGNKGVLLIPQSSSITGTSPSDFLVSYPGHSLVVVGGSYPLRREAVGVFYSSS